MGVEAALSEAQILFDTAAYEWGVLCGFFLLALWPLFIAEQLWIGIQGAAGPRHRFYAWLFCLIPPLRLCARQRIHDIDHIWFPWGGWQPVDRQLQRRLERLFSIPMIWIALLILPVLGLQLYFKDSIVNYPILRLALHIGTGLIWFAFAVEFIVMVSVSAKKLEYCKTHWLDLVIILLPLISFLRSLRLLRASKLMKIGKLQQLSRVVRAYRLRGVAMRGFRALLVLEIIHRLLRTKPESRIMKLEQKYEEKRRELEELQEQISLLKRRLEDQKR